MNFLLYILWKPTLSSTEFHWVRAYFYNRANIFCTGGKLKCTYGVLLMVLEPWYFIHWNQGMVGLIWMTHMGVWGVGSGQGMSVDHFVRKYPNIDKIHRITELLCFEILTWNSFSLAKVDSTPSKFYFFIWPYHCQDHSFTFACFCLE